MLYRNWTATSQGLINSQPARENYLLKVITDGLGKGDNVEWCSMTIIQNIRREFENG